MIRAYIEQAIKAIEAEKAQKIAITKERITREKIAPYNTDIDNARAKAIAELNDELNNKIVQIKQEYETKKQELISLGEQKKTANAEAVFANELAIVSVDYDRAIAKLTDQLGDMQNEQ